MSPQTPKCEFIFRDPERRWAGAKCKEKAPRRGAFTHNIMDVYVRVACYSEPQPIKTSVDMMH
jgi:hypothetical protein